MNPQRVSPKPCSTPGLGPTCVTMVSPQPGSIVTVLVSESAWRQYRIFGFGATPPRRHGSLLPRACSPLVPLCIAPHTLRIAPGGRPPGCPGNVVPEVRLPFVGRISRACMQPGTGPVLRHSRHVTQHTMPESGRAPGPPAGPGSFFGHCGQIWVFPSFGNFFGVPHPGIETISWAIA